MTRADLLDALLVERFAPLPTAPPPPVHRVARAPLALPTDELAERRLRRVAVREARPA